MSRRVFWLALLLYLVTWGGHYTSGDGAIKVAWARALIERGSSELPASFGVRYSKYGIGHTLIAVPPLVLSGVVNRMTGVRLEAASYTFLFLLNGAMFLALVARYLSGTYEPRRIWIVIALLGVATIWWPYTKLDFSEPLVATTFFWGFVVMREGRTAAGFFLASLAMILRVDAAPLLLVLGGWAVYRAPSLRTVRLLVLALLPAVAMHILSNYLRGGHLLTTGYEGETFSTPWRVGLYGLLFSPGKSILLFSPPLLLGVLGWRQFYGRQPADAVLFAAVFSVQLLLYATWWDWSGDDAWGARFMIPGVMLMTIPAVAVADRRLLVAAAFVLGVAVQLPAVLLSGLDYPLLVHRGILRSTQGTPIDLDDLRFTPRYSQLAGQIELVSHTPISGWDFIWLHHRP